TKPSRSLSQGRLAVSGESLRVDKAVFSVLSIRDQVAPPTINLFNLELIFNDCTGMFFISG
ncbi:hypothetical protein QUF54_10325, partial [Candidatus Marithioploca araucensis]|nr:hypothetical protein [Candidatus Marithioploca araucensis]